MLSRLGTSKRSEVSDIRSVRVCEKSSLCSSSDTTGSVLPSDGTSSRQAVFEKTCVTTQKMFLKVVFWILKNVIKRTYSFRGRIFNTQLPKVSTGKSPTSNIFAKNADVVLTFTKLCYLGTCVINVYKSSNTPDRQLNN